MSYADEIRSMEMDIDLEPDCFKHMNQIVKGLCMVPYTIYQLCLFGAIALATKLHA